jgi:hypothetical protein
MAPCLSKAVGALGARIERGARHREDFAPLLEGEARGNQRARALCRLDDDDTDREARDQSVAAREIAGARLPAERHLAHRCAVFQDFVEKRGMFGRVDAIVPAGEHGDGAAREARAMGGRIDPARQARDHHQPGFAEVVRKARGDFRARRRGIARTDHRDHRPRERGEIAAHGKQRGRIVDLGEPRRVGGLAQPDQTNAQRPRGRKLALGVGTRADSHTRGAAPARKLRQLRERRAGAAAVTKEALERAWPDTFSLRMSRSQSSRSSSLRAAPSLDAEAAAAMVFYAVTRSTPARTLATRTRSGHPLARLPRCGRWYVMLSSPRLWQTAASASPSVWAVRRSVA